jgi:hypothetical protein
MKRLVPFTLVVGILSGGSCASSKMSLVEPRSVPSRTIGRLAIAPGSGVLGEAISLELFNRGMTIVDAQEAVAIVGRAGLQEFEVTSTKGFELLREKGIDAVLTAKSVNAADGTPESASVRVTDTTTGQVIAGLTWQNGWGGMRGSVADRAMRRNLTEAANEIAQELLKRLRRSR